jgi:hypothetical protein
MSEWQIDLMVLEDGQVHVSIDTSDRQRIIELAKDELAAVNQDVKEFVANNTQKLTNPSLLDYLDSKLQMKKDWFQGVTRDLSDIPICRKCTNDNSAFFALSPVEIKNWRPKCSVNCIWFDWHANIRRDQHK